MIGVVSQSREGSDLSGAEAGVLKGADDAGLAASAGRGQIIAANPRGVRPQEVRQPDSTAFKGVPLAPGRSRLLQSFRSFVGGGKEEFHFNLAERRNAETGKYELVVISADPAGRKFPVMLLEGNRSVPARLEEFGAGQPLLNKLSRVLAVMNLQENRLPERSSDGLNLGNPRDMLAGAIGGVVGITALLPSKVEELLRLSGAQIGNIVGLTELAEAALTGGKPNPLGQSNLILSEQRAQFAQGGAVRDATRQINDGVARSVRADQSSVTYRLGYFFGSVVTPFLLGRSLNRPNDLAHANGHGAGGSGAAGNLPRAVNRTTVAQAYRDIASAPIKDVIDVSRSLVEQGPAFMQRFATHPDTAGLFQALQNRLIGAASTPGATTVLASMSNALATEPYAAPPARPALPPASRPLVTIPPAPPNMPQGPRGPGARVSTPPVREGVTVSKVETYRPSRAAEPVEILKGSDGQLYVSYHNRTVALGTSDLQTAHNMIDSMVSKPPTEVWRFTPTGSRPFLIFRRPDGGLSAYDGRNAIDLKTSDLNVAKQRLNDRFAKPNGQSSGLPTNKPASNSSQAMGRPPQPSTQAPSGNNGARAENTSGPRVDGSRAGNATSTTAQAGRSTNTETAPPRQSAGTPTAVARPASAIRVPPLPPEAAPPPEPTTFGLSTPTIPVVPNEPSGQNRPTQPTISVTLDDNERPADMASPKAPTTFGLSTPITPTDAQAAPTTTPMQPTVTVILDETEMPAGVARAIEAQGGNPNAQRTAISIDPPDNPLSNPAVRPVAPAPDAEERIAEATQNPSAGAKPPTDDTPSGALAPPLASSDRPDSTGADGAGNEPPNEHNGPTHGSSGGDNGGMDGGGGAKGPPGSLPQFAPEPEDDDPLGMRFVDWQYVFENPESGFSPSIDPTPAGQLAPRAPLPGDAYHFVDPVTGDTITFNVGERGFRTADGSPIDHRQGARNVVGGEIPTELSPADAAGRQRQMDWAVSRAISTVTRGLEQGQSLDDAINAGKTMLRGNPEAETLFDRKIGPAIWARRSQFKPLPPTATERQTERAKTVDDVRQAQTARERLNENLAAGMPLPEALTAERVRLGPTSRPYEVFVDSLLRVPLDISLNDVPYVDVLQGSAKPSAIDQAVSRRQPNNMSADAATDYRQMLGDAVEQVERARRALGQAVRDGLPMERARDLVLAELGDDALALQMFLGSLSTDPIARVSPAGLLGVEQPAPSSVYDQIRSDPRTAFQRFEVPANLQENPYSDPKFVPDVELRAGVGLRLNQGFEISGPSNGEPLFGTRYQMGSVAVLPAGNRIWGLIWANRFKILNSPDPINSTADVLSKAFGFGLRTDVTGTDPQLARNSSINPIRLGRAHLLSFKNADLAPTLLEWVRSGNAKGGLRFVPGTGAESIQASEDKTTGQTTVTVKGRLELDVVPYKFGTAPGATDFFGEPIRSDMQYYRLQSPLATKPLRETYLGIKTPVKFAGNSVSSSIEFRMEPNASTKVSIPEGAILPGWFVEIFNARFDDLPVGIRGVSPRADGLLGGTTSTSQMWLRHLAGSHPRNIEPVIGTESLLFPGVQRLSAIPGKAPNADALAFDVRFGTIESALTGAPTRVKMPDIYGKLYPGDLNISKTRVRTGLSVTLARTGEISIGPIILKLPSLSGEVFGQVLMSGNSPAKLLASAETSTLTVIANGVEKTVEVPRWLAAWLDKSLSEGLATSGPVTPPSQIALPLGGKKSLGEFLTRYEQALPGDAIQLRQAIAAFRVEVLARLKDGSAVDGTLLDRLIDLLVQMSDRPSLQQGPGPGLPPGAVP